MSVIQSAAEENFAQRLGKHLRARYSDAVVILPDRETTVGELADADFLPLVQISIDRARSRDFSFESSISAFSALMFRVAPNFDAHELAQPFLTDENIEPNARLDSMIEQLTEKDWETIKKTYDASAWKPPQPETEEQK